MTESLATDICLVFQPVEISFANPNRSKTVSFFARARLCEAVLTWSLQPEPFGKLPDRCNKRLEITDMPAISCSILRRAPLSLPKFWELSVRRAARIVRQAAAIRNQNTSELVGGVCFLWDANLSIGSRGRGLPGKHGVRANAKSATVYAALPLKFYSSTGGGIGEFSRKVRRKIP